jgi:hypothetical protein
MEHGWHTKYTAALLERNPALQSLRIAEAYEAIIQRMEELGETSKSETHKLENAIDTLKRLRDLSLERPA